MFCGLISAICLFLAVPSQARKYDIEAESLKLYKEDFQTALMRFRRTPEYLKILGDRENEFWIHINDMQNQITYFYLSQLSTKVKELMGLTSTPAVESLKDSSNGGSASFRSGFVYRRMLNDPNNKTAVERLDSYSKLSSALNLAQRNAMKDLGFQYAGDVIHSLIKNLGPDTSMGSEKSTMQPGGGGDDKESTTQHVHMHIVTTTTEAPVVEEEKLENEEVQGESKEEHQETDPSVLIPGQKKRKKKQVV